MVKFEIGDKVYYDGRRCKIVNIKYNEDGSIFTIIVKMKSGTTIEELPEYITRNKDEK